MKRSLTKKPSNPIPKALENIFRAPSLVGTERIEDYNKLFKALAESVSPRNAIQWIYVRDVVDLTWQIRRERRIKDDVIKLHQKNIILKLLKDTYDDPSQDVPPGDPTSAGSSGNSSGTAPAMYRVFSAADEAQLWGSDYKARKEIEARLAARGYRDSEILAKTYIAAASQIESFDKRIESCERRRSAIMREIERCDEAFARALRNAPLDVIDGEFSEAAE
ncbi:hypothetical protein FIU28_18875 [Tardiphaga sp. vice154]|uniref:hypothetical protein n=1 Tax=Tardiphaga sp. vice154 TaxID=2592814 RepID=UPI001165A83C|nr:hypothetical protein [Tardiphaga sp. vice154]QDM22990.1 hypothetical protein FIU28_18875 [Tardiphaga sp. vice154]